MARNWEGVRAAYIAQPVVDFGSLARDFGIPAGTIKNRASKGGWVGERDQTVTAVRENVTDRVATEMVNAIVERIAEHRRITGLFLAQHEHLIHIADTPSKLQTLTESWAFALTIDCGTWNIAAPNGEGALDDKESGPPNRLVVVDPGDPRAGSIPTDVGSDD